MHAAVEFALAHPHQLADTVALLAARDELDLCWLAADAARLELAHACFREPDLDDALTAVALGPEAARLCRKYPVALEGK